MANAIPNPRTPSAGVRESVMSIPAFRKLWNAMAFSSFGDWLGLLATTALAQQLAGGDYATANFAIACTSLHFDSDSWKLFLALYGDSLD